MRAKLVEGSQRVGIDQVGVSIQWIAPDSIWDCWKLDIQPRLVDGETIDIDRSPAGYCYTASEWTMTTGESAILVYRHH